MQGVIPEYDEVLTVTVAGIKLHQLARQHDAQGTALHHALIAYRAFLLLESLGTSVAAQLRLSSSCTNDGRKFWYEGTQISSTITVLSVARAIVLRGEELQPTYVTEVRKPPNLELFSGPGDLRSAQVQVVTGPYTVVTMIETPGMSFEEAADIARERAGQLVDVGLPEAASGPERDLS